jgi:hypothetical protein
VKTQIRMRERRNGKNRPQGYDQACNRVCCMSSKSGASSKISLGGFGRRYRRRKLTVPSPRESLDWLLTRKRIGAYVGVDPTAPSLHVGHLLPLMALYWMYLHGYYTITLVRAPTRDSLAAG